MYAGQQLPWVEGFTQVIVSADIEAGDAVHIFDFGGQHDDGRLDTRMAKSAANAQPIFAGEHQVQHHQVNGFPLQDAVQCAAVFGQQDIETFLRQKTAQQVANSGVIVNDDDFVKAG
jgi:hypothetical protein